MRQLCKNNHYTEELMANNRCQTCLDISLLKRDITKYRKRQMERTGRTKTPHLTNKQKDLIVELWEGHEHESNANQFAALLGLDPRTIRQVLATHVVGQKRIAIVDGVEVRQFEDNTILRIGVWTKDGWIIKTVINKKDRITTPSEQKKIDRILNNARKQSQRNVRSTKPVIYTWNMGKNAKIDPKEQ